MDWRRRLGMPLLILGLVGFFLGPRLGLSELGRPWSFLVGFCTGIVTGVGTVFVLYRLASPRPSC
jgi:hypothetical protein